MPNAQQLVESYLTERVEWKDERVEEVKEMARSYLKALQSHSDISSVRIKEKNPMGPGADWAANVLAYFSEDLENYGGYEMSMRFEKNRVVADVIPEGGGLGSKMGFILQYDELEQMGPRKFADEVTEIADEGDFYIGRMMNPDRWS